MTSRWFPHVTVAAVIERDNRFLLVRENMQPPVLNQPAGHLEENETLLEAIRREVLEETAHMFEPEHLVGIYRWSNTSSQTYVRFCFTGRLLQKTSREIDKDILEAAWLDLDTIRQSALRSPLVMQCINDYCDGRRYELSILNDLS
jgi:ADP-ribose pyrophosphatase YjhB (NUDIX family)